MRDRLLQGFRLGNLHIDPVTGGVTGNGAEAHLPSRAVEILLVLARQPGELISREDLLQKVWGDGNGSAEALSHAVSELRHGLADHAGDPVFVQTVPRRGYRLLVEPGFQLPEDTAQRRRTPEPENRLPFWQELMKRGVVQAGVAQLLVGWVLIQIAGETFSTLGLPPWAAPFVTYVVVAGFPIVLVLAWFLEFAKGRMRIDRGRAGGRRNSGLERNYQAIVAAYVLAALVTTAYQATIGISVPQDLAALDNGSAQAALPIEPDSIAVLRFMSIDDSPTSRIFSDGLAEDVLDRLARVPGLSVSSRGDAWSLPGNPSSGEVRRRLRVAYYLEGSVRLVDDALRVVVQLIDTRTGFHVVSRTFERKLENFMQVQKEVTDLTVANLRVALPTDARAALATAYADTNLDAYVLYRKGREIFDQPATVDLLAEAIGYFRQALDLDPGYAAAHAGLCRAFVDSYAVSGSKTYIDMAERSCAQALESNPNLHMVYTALGELYRETGRIALAEDAYTNALQRNSKDVQALLGLARVYERQHRLEEAEGLLNRSIRMQPGNWTAFNALGTFYFATGQYQAAADAFRKLAFLEPDNWQVQGNLGSALAMAGRFAEAATALERSIAISSQKSTYSNLGTIYYYLGDFEQSVAIHRVARDLDPNSNIVWLNLADALYFSGDEAAAREAFARAAELSGSRLGVDPGDVESLHALAWASLMLGDAERARELVNRALSIAPNDPYVYYYDALVRARSGDIPGSIASAEKAIKAGYPKSMLAAEPYLAPLQEQERFAALLAHKEQS